MNIRRGARPLVARFALLLGVSSLFLAVPSGCSEERHRQAAVVSQVTAAALSSGSLADHLQRHVEFLAQAPRALGTAQLAAARDYCANQLSALGYEVTRETFGLGDHAGQNVIGTLRGEERANEQVLLSAHIDSVRGCDGADDNASGVAGVIEAARYLAQAPHPRTLIVACWDQEEQGLLGSLTYATAAHLNNSDIRMSFVFEMIGYRSEKPNTQSLPISSDEEFIFDLLFPDQYQQYVDSQRRGDFIALVADSGCNFNGVANRDGARYQSSFAKAAAQLDLPTQALALSPLLMLLLPDMSRSDHASFWANSYPAMMISDTANLRNPNYHCVNGPDARGAVDFDFAARVTAATIQTVRSALDAEG